MVPCTYSHRKMLILEQGQLCMVVVNGVKTAVGEKENDNYFMAYEVVGRHTLRMPLMDVISVGAQLDTVSVNSVNEESPATEAMIKGMDHELKGLNANFLVSSENHFKSTVTGLGVTLLGHSTRSNLLLGKVEAGHRIWLHGAPVAGMEVADNVHRLPTAQWLAQMAGEKGVKELLPCGMQGIAAELDRMVSCYGLAYELDSGLPIDFKKSCGPYSGIVVIADETFESEDVIQIGWIR